MIPGGGIARAGSRRARPFLCGCVFAISVVGAHAGSVVAPRTEFRIPAEPLSKGLVAFALQAKISIGFHDLDGCGAIVRPLTGRFTIEDGLSRLLSGSGCVSRRIDARAYDVHAAPRPAPPGPSGRSAGFSRAPTVADLSELVVVATRRPTPAERLAYSVTSVSGATLRQQGVRDIGDLALVTPAMTLTNLGMGRDKILLRGLSDGPLTGLTQSLVGLYLDDTRLTYNAPDPDLLLVDMERVEVLRGPQGALYGAGSLGGVVHLVSRPPDPDRASVLGAATVGFTDGGGTSHSADAVFNLPFPSGLGAARLVLYHEVDGGYLYNKFTHMDDINSGQRNGGRLSMDFKLDDRWTLSGGGVIQHIAAADTQYTTVTNPPYARNTHLAEPHDNDFSEYHAGLTGELDWATAHASVAYIEHNIYSRYDASVSPPVRITPQGAPAAFDELDTIQTIVTEETLISPSSNPIQWLAGGFYAHTGQFTQLTLTQELPPPSIVYEELRHDSRDEGALFGEATFPIWRGLSLTGGGRLFLTRDGVTSVNTVFTAHSSIPYAGHVSETGFAPKIVIADRISSSLLLYAQLAEGYRGPGINTASAPGERLGADGGPEPLRLFKGDNMWSLETGAKYSALDGRLHFGLAGFDVRWKDIQSDQLLPSGIPFTANVGDGHNLGIEFESSLRLASLSVQAEAIFNNPTLTNANPAFPQLLSSGLGVVPDKSYGLSAHYSWPIWGRRSLAVDGRVAYIGKSKLMLNVDNLPTMGDYTTGRVAASLVDPHWRLTLAVDNPADAHANTFAYGNPFTIRPLPGHTVIQSTPLRPRTITLGFEGWF